MLLLWDPGMLCWDPLSGVRACTRSVFPLSPYVPHVWADSGLVLLGSGQRQGLDGQAGLSTLVWNLGDPADRVAVR